MFISARLITYRTTWTYYHGSSLLSADIKKRMILDFLFG